MLKDLRTSTKLVLLCGMFVAAIALATYSLIREKQIAIGFVRKELVGAQYLEALRGVYAVILEPALQASRRQASAIAALDALAKAEANTGGLLRTATLAENLETTVRDLIAAGTGDDSGPLTDKALAGARDLAARIGDESNLALDPALDSYYIQNIVVKRVPALLSQMGALQSLLTHSPSGDDFQVRPLLLDGMIRSSIEDINRDAEAASRRDADGQLKRTVTPVISVMASAVNSYLETANTVVRGQGNPTLLTPAFEAAYQRVDNAWAVNKSELHGLLNDRLANLLGKLRGSLLLNGLVAGLSLLFAAITYRQILLPLRQLEELAENVRETRDYSLRINLERPDEIGQLATAFNAMLAELSAAREREAADEARNGAMQAELARVARLTTMGEMAASIAHEINQPLAAVVNNANAGLRWLNREPPNTEEVRSALTRIVNDGERGGGIIESIRAMLKKGVREKMMLNLNELIRDVTRLTQGQFQSHGVAMRSELADDLPSVLADRIQLQQVILNLFMNAAEAMASIPHGERLVRVRSEKHDGGGVLIAVEDVGPGVEPEDSKRIFEAFFTTKAEGMGMGLSICRSIVESHGGRITVAKAAPNGTVFQVTLPGHST
ncbi:MAG TPA: ATP-binding protein [Terriglobales bacterium]|nr:ATP-binding protein [Terriglobales bacterium]